MIVFSKVRAITPHTLRSLYITDSHHMTSLPAILVLQYAWIHICTPNCCDETTNVDPYDGHVGFGGYLDDAWFRDKDNIIEQVVVLQNIFNII